MTVFELDTSGVVADLSPSAPRVNGEPCGYRWENLAPFAQGFTRAALESIGAHYRDLHPATLARFLKDCGARVAAYGTGTYTEDSGRRFWQRQQAGLCPLWPPLRLSPDPDGKIIVEDR